MPRAPAPAPPRRAARPSGGAAAPRWPARAAAPRVCVRTGTRGASARNSRASRRVRFATERTTRSSHRILYGKAGTSDMWMPPHTTVPPLSTARSAAGTRSPTGAKRIAASSGSGGSSSDPPAHSAPHARAKRGRLAVARAREGEHAPALEARDLRDDVSRRAEAVETEPRGIACGAQAAVADQSRAQERRRRDVVLCAGEREAVARVRERLLGIAAVARVAGEASGIAEILRPAQAEAAAPAGRGEPRDADARADGEALGPLADALHDADDLVSGDQRRGLAPASSPSTTCRSVRQTPHARTRTHSSPGRGAQIRQRDRLQRLARRGELHREHGAEIGASVRAEQAGLPFARVALACCAPARRRPACPSPTSP